MEALPFVLWGLSGAVIAAVSLWATSPWRVLRQKIDALQRDLERLEEGARGVSGTRLRELEDVVERLPSRWEDIKREAERLRGRADYAVRRARKELEARELIDDGLEGMAHELRLVDGEGGDDEGMHPVPADVVGAPTPAPVAPTSDDWEAVARARKFGL